MSKHKRGRPKKHESGGQISVWFDDKLKAELSHRAIVWTCSFSDTVNRLLMLAINGSNEFENDEEIEIETLEGTMKANKGDFIIRGVKGELYPCKEDIFYETYEKV